MTTRSHYSRETPLSQIYYGNIYSRKCYNPHMRKPTRRLIMDYLQKEPIASVRDLSRALSLTKADIRHHLRLLMEDGMVAVVDHRRDGRGRPFRLFRLSDRIIGDGLKHLVTALLDERLDRLPEEKVITAMRALALRVAPVQPDEGNVPPIRRISTACDSLIQFHYQPRWEAAADGPRIIFNHCPYSSVIERYPQLCQMDAQLLERMIGQRVEQVMKLQPNRRGLPICEFRVR